MESTQFKVKIIDCFENTVEYDSSRVEIVNGNLKIDFIPECGIEYPNYTETVKQLIIY